MDEIQDPGEPRTDELARNVALHVLADAIRERWYVAGYGLDDPMATADAVLSEAATVTWERDINSAGVAVRRYVLRGAWEVDPEAVTP